MPIKTANKKIGSNKSSGKKNYSGSKTSKPNSSQKKKIFKVKIDDSIKFSPKKKINKSLLQKNYGGSKTSKPKKVGKIEWRGIPRWTKYQASTNGEIRNFWTEKVLKESIVGGYYMVNLFGDGESESCFVHRLVAETFIDNPKNLPVVDHINNNKLDNRVENLRWVTSKENSDSYNKNFKQLRVLLQFDKRKKLIKKWTSMTKILKFNKHYRSATIYMNIRGKLKTAYGYIWEYEKPKPPKKEVNPNEKFKCINIFDEYDLSNYGASKNGNIINISKNTYMSQCNHNSGYMVVSLYCKNNKKTFVFLVHRLIAHVHIPNHDPKNKIEINHIDKNKKNNNYKNLEWMTHQENMTHGHGKMVKMIDVETNNVIKIFASANDASRFLKKNGGGFIGKVCNGYANTKYAYGYKWEWVGKDEVIDKPIITVPIKKKIKKK